MAWILAKDWESFPAADHNVTVFGNRLLNNRPKHIVGKFPEMGFEEASDIKGSGPLLILGMGPSRERLRGVQLDVPVLAINRAIREYPGAAFLAVHDEHLLNTLASKDAVLLTQPGAAYIDPKWRERFGRVALVWMDVKPSRWASEPKPLYWNVTTFGWALPWAVIAGFNPIYTLGVDLATTLAYKSDEHSDAELLRQHAGVRERTLWMWDKDKGEWPHDKAEIIDLGGGALPVKKGDWEEFKRAHGRA